MNLPPEQQMVRQTLLPRILEKREVLREYYTVLLFGAFSLSDQGMSYCIIHQYTDADDM